MSSLLLGDIGNVGIVDPSPPPLHIYYSCAPADEPHRVDLDKHLMRLQRAGDITVWHAGIIMAGSNLNRQAVEQLDRADVVLILLSVDYVSSDIQWYIELPHAMKRHHAKEALVIPVLVRSMDWDWNEPPFAELQVLPRSKLAVTSWPNRDEAWTDVVFGIRLALKGLRAGRP